MTEVNARTALVEVRTVKLTKNLLNQLRILEFRELQDMLRPCDDLSAELTKHIVGWLPGSVSSKLDNWSRYYLVAKDGDLYLVPAGLDCHKKAKQLYLA